MQTVTSGAVAKALKAENIESSILTVTANWIEKYTVDIRRLGNLLVVNMFFKIKTSTILNQNANIATISLKPLDYVRAIGIHESDGYAVKVEITSDGTINVGPFGNYIALNSYLRCESIIYGIEE